MKKRSVAFLLCISVLLSTFLYQISGALAKEKYVHILHEGNQISELTLQQSEKAILAADAAGIDASAYQWQILLDQQNSVWVNIYDKTQAQCEISYAVLKNLLDKANSAYIRCSVTNSKETVYSQAVCITVAPVYETSNRSASFSKFEFMQSLAAPGSAAARSPLARSVDSEYVTVTIKYLDISSLSSEESAVYSPYTATIEKGTDFKQNVVSPTFLGFAPYYSKDSDHKIDDDASTISLNLENVTENVEIKVYYKPIEVNFAIRYFFQNINNDLYTENDRLYHSGKAETGAIIEDSYLRDHAGDTTGFEKMYHIPETVAADGSTVFECYYDRNYYLIQFDLDGGYGVDPIYARYGTPYVVNEPTRHGYRFVGWDKLIEDTDNDNVPDKGDGKPDILDETIGADDVMYRALWESVNTTYTVAYWAEKDNGEREYLGAIRTPAKSGENVSGSDNLKDEYKNIFRFDEHIHSVQAGCYGKCPFKDHTHNSLCYTSTTLGFASDQTDAIQTAFNSFSSAVSNPTEGNIYKYRYQSGWRTYYYNFFYLGTTWYYLGTGTAYSGVSFSGALSNPAQNGGYNSVSASIKGNCPSANHEHTNECLSCTKFAHAHTSDCNPNPRYYVFDRADKNITVEGDGSAIVNIYYKPKEYTLRFFYARSTGKGNNIKYSVVGGSTYAFGGLGAQNPGDLSAGQLLGNVPESNWGEVTELPKWYEDTHLSGSTSDTSQYTLNSVTIGSYTYYYFDFKARYGDDISTKWPIGILSPVKTTEKHNHKYKYTDNDGIEHEVKITADQDYEYAYFSAWNGEYKVKYTQDHFSKATSPYNSDNQTIKGRYMMLDENLLYDGKFADSDVINYLGFWDNGANVEWSVPKLFRYHLMLEAPDGIETENKYDGKYYTQFQEFRTFDDSVVSNQTSTSISGFNYIGRTWKRNENGYTSVMGEKLRDAYDVYFYYERNDYTLTYFNYENVINSRTIAYDTLFTEKDFYKYPDRYPPSLEPDAYEFVGWYTSPVRIYPIEFDKAKMPAEDTIWYAKWVPVKHKVNFFISYDEMTAYENNSGTVTPYKTFADVEHGTLVGSVDNPARTGGGNMDMIFSGWFYIENGEKKAFTPLNMFINKDMNIFADWSSSSPQPYRMEYVLKENPSEKVADDTSGFAYAGSTRTFAAKVGNPYNQLYEKYNTGYFPTVASHSVTMQYEEDKDNPKLNVSTFYYVRASKIEYTVRYVNKETNTVMDEETNITSDSVVTPRFKAFQDMVPDAFYKRLVLSVKYDEETGSYVGSDENVVTFYYTPSTTSAYYAVHFMMEKLGATAADKQNYAIDGSGGYEESGAHVEGIGDIGSTVSIIPQEFSGFSLISDRAVSVVDKEETKTAYAGGQYSIKVTEKGTELYIFYERLICDYTVHYYLYNTTTPVSDEYKDKTGNAPFGSSITENSVSIPGYTCVSAHTQTISIRNDPAQNAIVFYYAPIQYVAEYVAVPSDGGILSKTIEVVSGEEALVGSVPAANEFYSFDGWYLDKECTQSVSGYGAVDDATNRFTPNKDKLSETDHNIFYAKFIRRAGDLTIVRSNAADKEQVFVYEVKNNATSEIITVTVTGNASATIKDLPFGDYTVTQKNEWSWRYDDSAQTAAHLGENGTTVQFSDSEAKDQWLNGNSALIQNQRGKSE